MEKKIKCTFKWKSHYTPFFWYLKINDIQSLISAIQEYCLIMTFNHRAIILPLFDNLYSFMIFITNYFSLDSSSDWLESDDRGIWKNGSVIRMSNCIWLLFFFISWSIITLKDITEKEIDCFLQIFNIFIFQFNWFLTRFPWFNMLSAKICRDWMKVTIMIVTNHTIVKMSNYFFQTF